MAHHHPDHAHHPHDHAGHGHLHGTIDPTLRSTALGLWAVTWSCVALPLTACVRLIVVALSGSVALLADTLHNFGDALTALPLWVAFALGRRRPTSASRTAWAALKTWPAWQLCSSRVAGNAKEMAHWTRLVYCISISPQMSSPDASTLINCYPPRFETRAGPALGGPRRSDRAVPHILPTPPNDYGTSASQASGSRS
jgi:hypothetical protein